MSTITVPQELDQMSDDELSDLNAQIEESAKGLAESAAQDEADLAEVERLIGEYDRIDIELNNRKLAAADRQARTEAALARFEKPVEEPAADEATAAAEAAPAATAAVDNAVEDAPVVSEAAPVTEPVVAAVEPEPVVETPAAVEPVVAPVVAAVEAPAPIVVPEIVPEPEVTDAALAVEAPVEAAPEDISTPEDSADQPTLAVEEPVEATVSESVPATPSQAVAALTAAAGPVADAPAPKPVRVRPMAAAMRATSAAQTVEADSAIDFEGLAASITKKRHQMSTVPRGTHDRVVLASTDLSIAPEQQLSQSEFANFGVFEHLQTETQALVASGGNCAPLNQQYEFFRLAEPMSPVEDALPVAQAPRGGIRFIVPPDFRDASAGVRVTTEEEDRDGYTTQDPPGDTEPKPCVSVECPDVDEAFVDAVSQCVTFGNLNYRVFPEQVQSFLKDLSVIFAETKEVFYLDGIDAGSTAVVSTPPYGAARGLVNDLLRASMNYRKRNHMPVGAPLDLLIPDWTVGLIKVDMVNDHSLGMGFLGATLEQVRAELFASLNLNVTFYYDSETGAGQAFDATQNAGPLNQWPETVVSYMYSPGTWVRLDVGTLDLGIVRDSVLNGTNDLQIFSEQWIQVVKVGIESLRIEHTLCPDGTGPEPAASLICGS